MRSLFLKIFLWFWVATILVVGVFVTFDLWGRTEHGPSRRRLMLEQIAAVSGEQAVDCWERGGAAALGEYCDRLLRTAEARAVLFDARGNELSGGTIPPGAAELSGRVRDTGTMEVHRTEAGLLVAARVTGTDAQPYVVVVGLRPGPVAETPPDTSTWVWRLGAVIVTSGIVCYALARYLTAPIRRLRAAARQLATGDLSVRVAAGRGRRRDEIGDLGRDFDYMAERVEALVSAQRRLLRDISHELRSPLARLSVALGLARRVAETEASPALDRMEREAERLNDLIGQLLTLTRLESGADSRERVPVPLVELVHEVAADAEYEAVGRDRHVCVVAETECTTVGSLELLRRAVENVVRNAVQYTPAGTTVEIALRCTDAGPPRRATIEVRDYGPGVPAGALRDIFRPFYRVAAARDRHSGGVGLGLAITAQAVNLHGGTVSATNAPEGGLLVQITLPCCDAAGA
jgi:two-component system sensor histidine kinase CpxA